ncbi:MAG: hypothetical protein C0505_06405 [Leptothrix sp. (in: Bacteria)]|nr:hypothetical protein [Leptothrix sp. (in: b-proteobacteria)]
MRLALAAGLALLCSVAAAQRLAPQSSPIVTFDPDREGSRPPTARALTAAELKLARERADAVYDAVKATPVFREPGERISLMTSWAVVGQQRSVEQAFTLYWTAPNDVRRRADGSLWPALGGDHRVFRLVTNYPIGEGRLGDPATAGNFDRTGGSDANAFNAFATPRVLGQLGGGTVYADMVVFTRDGRSVLEPAPLGPLLESEVLRLRKSVADQETGFAGSARELEASMTPQAIAARRARREARWKRETRDPVALATRLDAAHRIDEWDYGRQKERMSAPATRDPKSVWWGPRLALEAAQSRLASLDAAGLRAAACGRVDAAFLAHHAVRFELLAGAPADCVPMVQVRRDLIDPKRPTSEVQLLTISFGGIFCGVPLASGPPPQGGSCEQAVPLLRDVDWAAVRRAIGW